MDEKQDSRKLPVIYMAPLPKDRARRVFDAAVKILYGQCPEDPANYFCKNAEEFDEEICVRCWTKELFRALNGE